MGSSHFQWVNVRELQARAEAQGHGAEIAFEVKENEIGTRVH
jgi:hypothetical protein